MQNHGGICVVDGCLVGCVGLRSTSISLLGVHGCWEGGGLGIVPGQSDGRRSMTRHLAVYFGFLYAVGLDPLSKVNLWI